MEFKQLEIKDQSGWMKRTIFSSHGIKSIIYIIVGAVAGFLFFYFTEGKHMDSIAGIDVLKSLLIGGFFGFFITNSPCARNKC